MEFNAQEINKIKITSGFIAGLKIVEKDVTDIECTTKGIEEEDIKFTQKDDILMVSSSGKKQVFHFFNNGNESKAIRIAIPKGKKFQGVKIEPGVGSVEIKNISTSKLKIEAGAGYIFLKNVKVDEKVRIEGGTGKVETEGCEFTDTKISCGVGLYEIDAKLTGETEVSCGVGKVTLIVRGKKEDYNVKGDTGSFLNSIKVDGSDLKYEKNNNPDAKNTIRLNSGIGKLDVKFKD